MAQAFKQVLIVDDSRTAAVALGKLLDKFGISAATVESGEDALAFLQLEKPDLIFMDHMMPGMDGFDAVKAIKAEPATAGIPIVMYTSKGGDIYVGQARALGAVGILSKPVSESELASLLETIPPPRKPASLPTFNSSDTMELDAHAIAMAVDLSSRDSGTDRYRSSPDEPRRERLVLATDSGQSFWGSGRQWFVAVVFLLSSLWLLYLYLPAQDHLKLQQQENRELLEALQWSLNQERSFDFGQAPLSDELAGMLRQLLPRLQRAGFRGQVVLEGHVGQFCLTRAMLNDGTRVSMLPEADMPLSACAKIGYSASEAARESVLQSEGFSEYIKASGLLLADAPIRVSILPMGSRTPKYPYPTDLQGLTAGDWNAIALNNNRVHIFLVADSALN